MTGRAAPHARETCGALIAVGSRPDGGAMDDRHTVGRDQMPSAVRKAEARSPGAAPPSQVAANLTGQVHATAGPKRRRGSGQQDRKGMGTNPGFGRGWSSYAFAQALTIQQDKNKEEQQSFYSERRNRK